MYITAYETSAMKRLLSYKVQQPKLLRPLQITVYTDPTPLYIQILHHCIYRSYTTVHTDPTPLYIQILHHCIYRSYTTVYTDPTPLYIHIQAAVLDIETEYRWILGNLNGLQLIDILFTCLYNYKYSIIIFCRGFVSAQAVKRDNAISYQTNLDENVIAESVCVRLVEGISVYTRTNDQHCTGEGWGWRVNQVRLVLNTKIF